MKALYISSCALLTQLAAPPYVCAQLQPRTILVSTDSSGVSGNDLSQIGNASEDGRYVVFVSQASNLVPSDNNGVIDVFVKDLQSGTTIRASVSSSGAEGNGHSAWPIISGDGNSVVFTSHATNLVPGDTNGVFDIFHRDLRTGTTTRVNVSSLGAQANADAFGVPSFSRNGRYVGFCSRATNLVPGDSNGAEDSFVRDLHTNSTTRVSLNSSGGEANSNSRTPHVTPDGHYAVFESLASNLVANDSNSVPDIFRRDLLTGRTERVSESAAGIGGDRASRFTFATRFPITDDGRLIVFSSYARNLVINDTNGGFDCFVKNMRTGDIFRANLDSQGRQSNFRDDNPFTCAISGDGRFVVFDNSGSDLVPNDSNGFRDVFVHDIHQQTTALVSVDDLGLQADANSWEPTISENGRFVVFYSDASNLTTDQLNTQRNTYYRDRGGPFAQSEYLTGGCGGVGDSPFLATTSPVLGGQVTISGEFVPSGATVLVLASLSPAAGLRLGAGCILHVSPASVFALGAAVSDAQGSWRLPPLSLPSTASLAGANLVLQSLTPGSAFFGVDLSNGRRWTLGF